MKLAFSTIGCPDWSFEDIVATAKDLHYNGIEIRGVKGELYAPSIKTFAENAQKTTEKLQSLGLEISCFASGAALAIHDRKDFVLKEAKDYVDLASKMQVPFIRVMSTDKPHYDGGDIQLCKRLFKELTAYALDKNVTPLMETNGLFVDTALLANFLEETGGGALWDIHHPYRFNGESMEQTVQNLGKHIRYVHLKDSVVQNGNPSYRIMGQGDIPIDHALLSLKQINYDGYFTMEWVKRWNRELEEPGVVFAHFPYFMKRALS